MRNFLIVNQQVVFFPPLWRDVTFWVRMCCGRFTESSLSWSGKRWVRTETQGTQGTFHTIASLNARLSVARVCIKQAEKWIIKLKRTRKTCSEFCHPYCGGKGGKTNMAVQYHLSEKPMVDGRSRVLSVCLCICRPVLQFSSYRCLRVFCVPIARLKCWFRHPHQSKTVLISWGFREIWQNIRLVLPVGNPGSTRGNLHPWLNQKIWSNQLLVLIDRMCTLQDSSQG